MNSVCHLHIKQCEIEINLFASIGNANAKINCELSVIAENITSLKYVVTKPNLCLHTLKLIITKFFHCSATHFYSFWLE